MTRRQKWNRWLVAGLYILITGLTCLFPDMPIVEILEPLDGAEVTGPVDIVVRTGSVSGFGTAKCDSAVLYWQGIRLGALDEDDKDEGLWKAFLWASDPKGYYTLCVKAYNKWFESSDTVIYQVVKSCTLLADYTRFSEGGVPCPDTALFLEKDHLYAVVWWGGYEKEGAEVLLEVGFWDWYHNRWDDLVYEGSFKRIGDYRELRVDSNAVYCFKWEYPVVAPIRFLIFDYPPEEDL